MTNYGTREALFQSRIGKQPSPRAKLAAAYHEGDLGGAHAAEVTRRRKQREADREVTVRRCVDGPRPWVRTPPAPRVPDRRLVRAYARRRARYGTGAA